MKEHRPLVRAVVTAFFVSLICVSSVGSEEPQTSHPEGTALDRLVRQATERIQERFLRPIGEVAERRRKRVVLASNLTPTPGTLLEIVRPSDTKGMPRSIARVEVQERKDEYLICRERERTGRDHAEPGDLVRMPPGHYRVLLVPCVSLADVAPQIPEVIGEKLHAMLQQGRTIRLVDDPKRGRRAEAAYVTGSVSAFIAAQKNVDEVLFPVLLQTPDKLILNLEYYGVRRGRLVEIDVASVTLDDQLRAWLAAGTPQQAAPPGFRRLASQRHPWRVTALGGSPTGHVLVVDRDSVHVFEFEFPGLRHRGRVSLLARNRTSRETQCVLAVPAEPGAKKSTRYLLSSERQPLVLRWGAPQTESPTPRVRLETDGIEKHLVEIGNRALPEERVASWWPAPDRQSTVFQPCFADLDGDGAEDASWTEEDGALRVRLAAERVVRTFRGFGDVKAVQPTSREGERPVLWLTDPVWHGAPDRLHAARLAGDDIHLEWTSGAFEGTITALACPDLNADGFADLVAAEALEDGTRLHAFLALPAGKQQGQPPNTEEGP